jgi:DNA mismatch endonuclease (patch repair protein)
MDVTDQFSPALRSWIMSQVKSKNTGPERTVRSLAHKMGYRFRLHSRNLPGMPDIVFPARRKVIFVNGCFWHSHSCKRARLPATRRGYWASKIAKTILRDRRHIRQLRSLGWKALTIWECQLKDLVSIQRRMHRFLA